ncbi:MAG: Hpt domain-containing protein [Ignavibacteriales bacterium]|nr:Hpt domain-containing protein [Ignavibacteriales bacterium]
MQTPPRSDSDQLEQAVLERIRQLGLGTEPGFILDLIDSYAPLFQRLHASILDSLERRDRDTLHYAAHSLKGACLNVGAADLAAVARAIEEHSQKADFATIAQFLNNLDDQLKRTMSALSSISFRLSQQKPSL